MSLPYSEGTDAVVYIGKRFAYRVSGLDTYDFKRWKALVGHKIPNLVRIYDVWSADKKFVVKMDKLFEPPNKFCDRDELNRFYDAHLFSVQETENFKTTCPILSSILKAQVSVAKAVGETIVDSGPHNIMLDSNGQLVVIDPL